MSNNIKPEPALIVIFGVTGDLVKRKLFPALLSLIKSNLLHESTIVIGITRQNLSTEKVLRELILDNPNLDETTLNLFKLRFQVKTMDVNNEEDYSSLRQSLDILEEEKGMCMNKLFYLSIPPQVFSLIVGHLGRSGLNSKCKHNFADSRLLIEKPFGYDLESAKKLITDTSKYFKENQIFRIDHYLAKETVQNILSFRFNNAIFESLWKDSHISLIEIEAIETLGIENRANFYEHTGALRDIIQSHLIQLMAIIMMEEPTSFSSEHIHESKLALLKSAIPLNNDNVESNAVRGQYETYRSEVENEESVTETYAALKVEFSNDRWNNVPIILKTGKSLNEKKTEVKVIFKRKDKAENTVLHNSLTFRIQPNEGIDINIIVKKPGLDNELELVDMDFSYSKFFQAGSQPDAYERVLIDAIKGDHTLFSTSEEVLAAWEIVDKVIMKWSNQGNDLQIYNNNSSGPKALPNWLKIDYSP